MSSHKANLRWRQDEDDHFSLGRYTRVHEISFDGGTTMIASASPAVVPLPFSSEQAVDPEEMLVAALSSCHMLSFLDIARRAGIEILSYEDQAEGFLEKNELGRFAITRVILRPKIETEASVVQLDELHEKAHRVCFIANSVTTKITIEAQS